MAQRKPDQGRHHARKRAVDLLFEAEARGLTPAEVVDSRTLLAGSNPEVSALMPYTAKVARGVLTLLHNDRTQWNVLGRGVEQGMCGLFTTL